MSKKPQRAKQRGSSRSSSKVQSRSRSKAQSNAQRARAYRQEPHELLRTHPDDTLDLSAVYDGDPSALCQGVVVSRRGPVMVTRWIAGDPPVGEWWGGEEREHTLGDTISCIARGYGKGAVVGDTVHFMWERSDLGLGLIIAVELRENALVRADALGRSHQTLAANLDRIWVVSALDPPPKSGLIDRYLVAAHANQIPVGLILNKVDLFMDEEHIDELASLLAPYRRLKIPILLLSALAGDGVTELRAALKGERSVFVGHSGVGKTSLLNALVPGLDEAVKKVSEATGKGQHTTTTSTLYELEGGGELIDSPGIRGFGLWGMPAEELKDHFVEFLEFAASCYFNNCSHLHEPDCAVLAAVDRDEIDYERYETYTRIYDDLFDLEER